MKPAKDVDAYMSAFPPETRKKLKQVRAAITQAAPDAVESISYGMPFYSFRGESGFNARLCYFGITKDSIAFYMRPHVFERHEEEVSRFKITKSALHLSLDRPVPVSMIKKLVRTATRVHEDEKRKAKTMSPPRS